MLGAVHEHLGAGDQSLSNDVSHPSDSPHLRQYNGMVFRVIPYFQVKKPFADQSDEANCAKYAVVL